MTPYTLVGEYLLGPQIILSTIIISYPQYKLGAINKKRKKGVKLKYRLYLDKSYVLVVVYLNTLKNEKIIY